MNDVINASRWQSKSAGTATMTVTMLNGVEKTVTFTVQKVKEA